MNHIWEQTQTKDVQKCKCCELLKIKGFKKVTLKNGHKIMVVEYSYYNTKGVKEFKDCFEPKQYKLEL